jgi:hypothetical protein
MSGVSGVRVMSGGKPDKNRTRLEMWNAKREGVGQKASCKDKFCPVVQGMREGVPGEGEGVYPLYALALCTLRCCVPVWARSAAAGGTPAAPRFRFFRRVKRATDVATDLMHP